MKHKVFSLYDSKTEVFDIPMFAKTTNEMIRDLTRVVNRDDERNKLHLYSSDFTLFEIGEYSDDTGKFELLATPHSLFILHDLKKLEPVDESSDS